MDIEVLVAEFYEAEYGPLEADAAFFSRNGTGGRTLVLGCGTGRVSRRLAQTCAVVGLDLSPSMLDIARRLSPGGTFEVGDMRAFDLGTFAEIIIPNGAFAFLPRRVDQHACLSACRRALRDDGRLTIDIPMPDFARWSIPHGPERVVWEGRVHDRTARRTRETRRSLARQRLELMDRYYLDDVLVGTNPQVLRVMLPSELEWMLEATGFYVDRQLGDYAGNPIRDGCPRILTCAVAI